MKHDLIKTGDGDAFAAIQDRNGEVALAYCRRCRKGEAELAADNCVLLTADTITDEQIEELVHDVIENGDGFVVNGEYVPTAAVISFRDEALEHTVYSTKAAQRRFRRKAREFFAEILNARNGAPK